MGLWTCPYCTLENPNWKNICEACEKIKPFEKQFNPNGELLSTKMSSPKPQIKKSVSANSAINANLKNDRSSSEEASCQKYEVMSKKRT
jgi:hypothetical protein